MKTTLLLSLLACVTAVLCVAHAAPPANPPHGELNVLDPSGRTSFRAVDDLTNGVLITHYPPGSQYTNSDQCLWFAGHYVITSCDQQNPRMDTAVRAVWFVLAAWNESKNFCGVEFGFGDFDPALLWFAASGPCPTSALPIPSGEWPGPNTGVSLAATTDPWSGNFVPVYWFDTLNYYPGLLPLGTNPGTGFGGFANCLTPPESFPAVCFGAMGLFQAGQACCPPSEAPHVCCVGETCSLVLGTECAAMGGVFHPEWNSCTPNPCRLPHVCCVGETCSLVLDTECAAAGGVFHPEWNSCSPNPCRLPHVCCVGESCSLVLDTECAAAGGVFHPEWNSCTPNPCRLPHVCCVGETCSLVLDTECAAVGGVFHPEWNSCTPNPCRLPHVCCVGETCSLVLDTECAQMGGVFHPTWNSCTPNPCALPHVCCVGETCSLVLDTECAQMGGVFHPGWDSCGPPNPCFTPPPTHVCCVSETCFVITDTECAQAGGVFHPEWDSCTPNPCRLPHVCCVGETCSLVLDTECASMGGVFHPEWNSCTPNPCSLNERVCCVGAECVITNEFECHGLGGGWQPDQTSCLPNPCAQPLRVCPDGSGQFLTIQAAVNAAVQGQTIVLCDGIYQGDGNRDILIDGKALYIESESGDPDACTILCEGTPEAPHRGFDVRLSGGAPFVLTGVTIQGAYVAGDGGAVLCQGGVPTFVNCRILGNRAVNGGGIACIWPAPVVGGGSPGVSSGTSGSGLTGGRDPQPAFTDCVITGNLATTDGGGVFFNFAPASVITECTFSGNFAGGMGGGAFVRLNQAELTVFSTILWGDCADGEGDEAYVTPAGSGIVFDYCDVATNGVAGPASVTWGPGNIHADPGFCGAEPCGNAPTSSGNYRLSANSPCVTHIDVYDGIKGALGVGCGQRSTAMTQAPPTDSHELWLSPSVSNPAGATTLVRYAIPLDLAAQPVALRIFDSAGRLIRVLDGADRTAGVHEILWDGNDLHGQPVDGGVYFCRLEVGSSRVASRLLRVR